MVVGQSRAVAHSGGSDETAIAAGDDIERAWADPSRCGNCGTHFNSPFCSHCGQKAVKRLVGADIVRETWERWRLCEFVSLRTVWHLAVGPGRVAREYVFGRRKAHSHPLTLLIALVALLVVMLATNRYFQNFGFSGQNSDVDRMAERVMAYSTWSFSLGIFAILAGSWVVFGRRSFNLTEHAVLAIYCQVLILAVIVVNMVPTLVWRDPAFVLWHKTASQHYLYAIKLTIVAVAYKQFFLLKLKRDWPKLAAACLIYMASSWLLFRLYAMAILFLVTRSA